LIVLPSPENGNVTPAATAMLDAPTATTTAPNSSPSRFGQRALMP
jgi:hypothetical protein